MTPEEIAVVQRTFAAVMATDPDATAGGALAGSFYTALFVDRPAIRDLFPADMDEQRRKFTDSLATIVWSIANLDELVAMAKALGARHAGYGVASEHYAVVGDAMMAALATALGDDFTDEVEGAWRAAYDLVAETMMIGAAEAAHGGSRPAVRRR